METRSHKRVEGTAQRPSLAQSSRGNKRARLSSAFAASPIAPHTRLPSRTLSSPAVANLRSQLASVDLEMETSGSGSRREHEEGEIEKGKEKETGVGATNDDSDGEENEVEGVGGLHQNFATANSALQGLLRKLGAGLDDFLPPSMPSAQQSNRFKKILSSLRAEGEIGRQVEALTQLCESLSIATEDSLSSFPVDSFVPVLVGLVNSEGNADIMLLAARALTHLCDVLPHSCASVVHYGAVPSFCARLLTIEYMDLAEQSLQALEKISHDHPAACLRAGGLMAVLSYLDFFSTGVQRVALSTAANICKKLPCDAADYVMEAVPILTKLLQYQDLKVVEHASVCLTGIAESFAASSEKLDELCNHGLVAQAARLISVSSSGSAQTSLSTQTYTGLIRLLSTFSSGSASSAKTLLDLNISTILKNVLAVSSFVPSISGSPVLNRPPDQTYEILTILNELLPPLPQGTISLPPSCSMGSKCPAKSHIPDSNTEKPEDIEGMLLEISDREKILRDQPELLAQFGMDLFPVLVQVYGSSVNSPVRHKCLMVISKLVYFSTADMLLSLLRVTNIPSFLSGILAWKDLQVLVTALQIAEVLIQKLPDVFPKMFVKEGVVHAVDTLILSDLSSPSSIQASVSGKHQYISTLALPKSACSTLCSGESNGEGAVKDELNCSNAGRVDSPLLSGEGIIPTIQSNILATVSAHAKHFKETYFSAHSGVVDMGITESLCKLKTLCMKLNNYLGDVACELEGKDTATETVSIHDEHLLDVIAAILTELGKGDGVSTFEFVESRVTTSLLKYFSCGALSKENMTDGHSSKVFKQALKRLKLFIRIALPLNGEDGREAAMTILVRKLQSALSVSERFPVILNYAPRSRNGNGSISAGLNTLSQPFKLRFSRAQGEISLRDYSSNTMYIESLATFAAIEEFLWPRIQKNEPSQKSSANLNTLDSCAGQPAMTSASSSAPIASEHQPSTRSTSSVAVGSAIAKYMHGADASSLKGKEKAVMKNIVGETKCPPIKNPTCAKAASDRSSQSKQPQGNCSAEEEEFDVSPVEIDDAAAMEEDISEDGDDEYEEHEEHLFGGEHTMPCVMERVHDVQLGNPIDDSAMASSSTTTCDPSQQSPGACAGSTISSGTVEIAEFFRGAAVVSKGSPSFARDAMSGLVSSSGRGCRGSRHSQALPIVNPTLVPPRLNFFIGGKQLDRSLTIYQAIQQHVVEDQDDMKMFTASEYAPGEGRRLWDEVYNITYQRATAPEVNVCAGESMSHSSVKPNESCATASSKQALLLNSILQGELPCDLEKSNCTYDILLLLRVLEDLNRFAPYLRVEEASDAFAEGKIGSFDELKVKGPVVPQEEFLNRKLTSKLARQIQDPVASCSGVLLPWCQQLTKACPFLFPFETRRHYFHLASFGLSRAVQRFQQQQSAENSNLTNHQELRIGRLQRQKVRVSRNRILDSAAKVMEMYSCHRAVLEVEYFGEVGTGLGPTLEFYTLLSHELQKQVLGIWRSSSCPVQSAVVSNVDMQVVGENGKTPLPAGEPNEERTVESEEFVQAPLGLFPRPWPVNLDNSSGIQFSKVIGYFRLLGQVMAKALQDGRLLDLPFSPAFYRLVLGQELDLLDIQSFDLELGSNLQEMQVFVCRKKFLESLPGDNRKAISELRFHNARIEDLCLDFTLPGYSDYVLKPGGNDIMVDMDNLEEYVSLVVDATVKTGIMRQIEAFRAGFNQVFSLESLQIFSENELESLLCGGHDLWAAHTLVDHIKFDHGYTSSSPVIINFLEIIGEFTPDQQRAFLRFVTGAPRLPPGGLAALSPKLTIVRKHFTGANGGVKGTAAQAADGDLPSVMTCANYLKLPPYSCKEVMRDRLLYAITEGQGSFDLS